jgi:hypothetical protein
MSAAHRAGAGVLLARSLLIWVACPGSILSRARGAPLSTPVIWHAPFFSGGGYCSEAIAFVQALTAHNATVQIEQVRCVCMRVCV